MLHRWTSKVQSLTSSNILFDFSILFRMLCVLLYVQVTATKLKRACREAQCEGWAQKRSLFPLHLPCCSLFSLIFHLPSLSLFLPASPLLPDACLIHVPSRKVRQWLLIIANCRNIALSWWDHCVALQSKRCIKSREGMSLGRRGEGVQPDMALSNGRQSIYLFYWMYY